MKRTIKPFGNDVINLRPIEEKDLEHTLKWRNHDAARVWFKSSEIISIDQHRAWFNHYLNKNDDFLFIVETEGNAVGQASVYGINWGAKLAEVGRFLVAPEKSGRGFMDQACRELVEFCKRDLGLAHIFLEVFEKNIRAIQIYERNGFIEVARSGGLIKMKHKTIQK